jgi:hypothetical protein
MTGEVVCLSARAGPGGEEEQTDDSAMPVSGREAERAASCCRRCARARRDATCRSNHDARAWSATHA